MNKYTIPFIFLIKMGTATFNDTQRCFTMTRNPKATCYVTSYHTHIFGQNQQALYGKFALCNFLYFYEKYTHMLFIPITICIKQIQESCFEIRFQVFFYSG